MSATSASCAIASADTVAAIQDARMRRADVLVTMGGASVGDYDLVQQALTDEGIESVVLEDRDAARAGR